MNPPAAPTASSTASEVLPVASIRRLLAEQDAETAACELCGGPLPDGHEHVADIVRRSLRCACPTCTTDLAPTDPGVRRIPDGVRRLDPSIAEQVSEGLGAPVGLVFLLLADDGTWTAHYPGAAGVVTADLDPGQTAAAMAGLAAPDRPLPEVQALLVDRRRGRTPSAHIVPVDRCYAIAERLRQAWAGVDGGSEADLAVRRELADLDRTRMHRLLAAARRVGDAVLTEGQVLYPFRADALKNQWRWTIGIVWPRAWATHPDAEPWWATATFLVKARDADVLHVVMRHQQLVHRTTEGGGTEAPSGPADDWDEVRTVEHAVATTLADAEAGSTHDFTTAGGVEVQHGEGGTTVRRTRHPVTGRLQVSARRVGEWHLLEVRVENTLDDLGAMPEERLAHIRRALVGTQVLLATDGIVGSLRTPAPTSLAALGQAVSERLWPVRVDDHVAIATGMILPEPPTLSATTAGDSGDTTEIEEMMALRVQTLLPEEKAAASATDTFAAGVIERLDGLTPEQMARLHATGRVPGQSTVVVNSQVIGVGARVRLRPKRRADAMDLALDGRVAIVDAVLEDLDGSTLVRVTVEDDPGADLLRETGRGFHFAPDELALLPTTIVAGVGNVFLGDDGFGPAVIAELRSRSLAGHARLEDYGIRGVHLAWDLAAHVGRVVIVDAIDLDQPPGTVVLLDPAEVPSTGPVDGHDLQLPAVLAKARELGADLAEASSGRLEVIVVGCVPGTLDESMGLSEAVAAAVGPAADRIVQLLEES